MQTVHAETFLVGVTCDFHMKAHVFKQECELLEGAVNGDRKGAWHTRSMKIKCQQNIYVHGL